MKKKKKKSKKKKSIYMEMASVSIIPGKPGMLKIVAEDGRKGVLDMNPYIQAPPPSVFHPLQDPQEFAKVINGGFFIAWPCGADLSADSVEALMTSK